MNIFVDFCLLFLRCKYIFYTISQGALGWSLYPITIQCKFDVLNFDIFIHIFSGINQPRVSRFTSKFSPITHLFTLSIEDFVSSMEISISKYLFSRYIKIAFASYDSLQKAIGIKWAEAKKASRDKILTFLKNHLQQQRKKSELNPCGW